MKKDKLRGVQIRGEEKILYLGQKLKWENLYPPFGHSLNVSLN